jgi:hypothetical protein
MMPAESRIVTETPLTFVIVVLAIDKYSRIGLIDAAKLIDIILTRDINVTPSPPELMFGVDGTWAPLNPGAERY